MSFNCIAVRLGFDPLIIVGCSDGSVLKTSVSSFEKYTLIEHLDVSSISALSFLTQDLIVIGGFELQIRNVNDWTRLNENSMKSSFIKSIAVLDENSFISCGDELALWNVQRLDRPEFVFNFKSCISVYPCSSSIFAASTSYGTAILFSSVTRDVLWESNDCVNFGKMPFNSIDFGRDWLLGGTDGDRLVFYKMQGL